MPKRVGRKKGPTRNGTLRTIKDKNYQYKEITSNKSSSSSQGETEDPFSNSDDDDEKIISGLLKMFSDEAHITIPNYLYKQIMNDLLDMGQNDAIDLMYTVIDRISSGKVQSPIGYLKASITTMKLANRQRGEMNGTN